MRIFSKALSSQWLKLYTSHNKFVDRLPERRTGLHFAYQVATRIVSPGKTPVGLFSVSCVSFYFILFLHSSARTSLTYRVLRFFAICYFDLLRRS